MCIFECLCDLAVIVIVCRWLYHNGPSSSNASTYTLHTHTSIELIVFDLSIPTLHSTPSSQPLLLLCLFPWMLSVKYIYIIFLSLPSFTSTETIFYSRMTSILHISFVHNLLITSECICDTRDTTTSQTQQPHKTKPDNTYVHNCMQCENVSVCRRPNSRNREM